MATVNEATVSPFTETFDNLSKATESAMHLQQELCSKWTELWPGVNSDEITKRRRQLQEDFGTTITDFVRNNREILKQCRSGLGSLEEALRVVVSENAEEARDAYHSMCLKALNVMKTSAETQVKYLQEAIQKMS